MPWWATALWVVGTSLCVMFWLPLLLYSWHWWMG